MPPRKKPASSKKKSNVISEKVHPAKKSDDGLELSISKDFRSWMLGAGISLAVTAPSASKLFIFGAGEEAERLSVAERTIERCRGLAVGGRSSLYVSSSWQIWRFENALAEGEKADVYDAVYVPKASHVTGDIDCQDMAIDGDGRLVFVNTRFNCLSYLSRDYSFHPAWKPEFIANYVAEDRCHLSGLALNDGKPAFVTAYGDTDTTDGWRDGAVTGGVVVDVASGNVLCKGLNMPRAPRVHGRTLWLLNAGSGHLGRLSGDGKTFEAVALCPGLPRSMEIIGNFAVISVARPGKDEAKEVPQLMANLKEHDIEPRCGLVVVDLVSGKIMHWLRLDGVIDTLDNIGIVPGVYQARAVGFKNDEIARTISLPPDLPA